MNTCRYSDKDFSEKIRAASSASDLFNEEIENRTRAIVREVALRGDDALLEFTEKFDGAKLTANQLAVTQAELMTASLKADDALRAAVAEAERNIAGFAKLSLRRNWQSKNS